MQKFFKHSKQAGQSTVEYVLLLGVVSVLTVSLLRSDALNNALGEDSELMGVMRARMEYAYRHGREGDVDGSLYEDRSHETYRRPGGSRFFLPQGPYPP